MPVSNSGSDQNKRARDTLSLILDYYTDPAGVHREYRGWCSEGRYPHPRTDQVASERARGDVTV